MWREALHSNDAMTNTKDVAAVAVRQYGPTNLGSNFFLALDAQHTQALNSLSLSPIVA